MSAFLQLKPTKLVKALAGAGPVSFDRRPMQATHAAIPVPQPSPRNTKSRYPLAVQQQIFEAAELKRQRKEAARVGIDLDGEL